MYALVKIGGQQHKVEPGRYVTVNRLAADEGGAVQFDEVLMVRTDGEVTLGTPSVDGAVVRGSVRRHVRGPKINGFIYRAKKGSSKRWGARADLTQVNIEAIEFGGQVFAAAAGDQASEEE